MHEAFHPKPVLWDSPEGYDEEGGEREFRKMVMMSIYAGKQRRHRCKEQTSGLSGRKRGWDGLRE